METAGAQKPEALAPGDAQDGVGDTTTTQAADLDHPEGDAIRRQVSRC
jgi:hypothetical protein